MELSARVGIELLLSGGQVRAGDAACFGAPRRPWLTIHFRDSR